MSGPKLDPRVKHLIKVALEDFMYLAVNRSFKERLLAILQRNTVDCVYPHQSFSYKGVYYSFELVAPRFKTQKLLPEFHPAMDELLTEQKRIEYTEKPYIFGFFNKVLNASNSINDYYRLLPECVHDPIRTVVQVTDLISYHTELSDEQVEQFQLEHQSWILQLKSRMVLDLIT